MTTYGLMQCQQDAQRFASTREQRAQQEINVVLNGLDANLAGIVRMRREFGPDATDAEVLGMFVEHAADAIERQLALARGAR